MEIFTFSKLSSRHRPARIITLIFFLSFFTSLTKPCLAARLEPRNNTSTEFIRSSCGATMYPRVCFKTLSAYASTIKTSPTELAITALCVTLERVQSASNKVANLSKARDLSPREARALMDCVETMGDSIDVLKQSLLAMKDLEGPDFEMKMSNILTWVSAALTDEDTCMEGFEGEAMNGKIKSTVRGYIVSVAQLTSNALALVNRLSSTQVSTP